MLITCYSDIHNMLSMLSYPTTLRKTVAMGVDENLRRFGKADLTLVGGDTVSDYPSCRESGWLPYRNFLDLKQKLSQQLARGTKDEKVLYVAGNHDYACGEGMKQGYSSCPYNSADYYDTGPMKQTLGELPACDACTGYSERLGREAGSYLLGFHYEIGGLDFYGLNFHPDEIYSHQGMLPGSMERYSEQALVWLKQRLRETDRRAANQPLCCRTFRRSVTGIRTIWSCCWRPTVGTATCFISLEIRTALCATGIPRSRPSSTTVRRLYAGSVDARAWSGTIRITALHPF